MRKADTASCPRRRCPRPVAPKTMLWSYLRLNTASSCLPPVEGLGGLEKPLHVLQDIGYSDSPAASRASCGVEIGANTPVALASLNTMRALKGENDLPRPLRSLSHARSSGPFRQPRRRLRGTPRSRFRAWQSCHGDLEKRRRARPRGPDRRSALASRAPPRTLGLRHSTSRARPLREYRLQIAAVEKRRRIASRPRRSPPTSPPSIPRRRGGPTLPFTPNARPPLPPRHAFRQSRSAGTPGLHLHGRQRRVRVPQRSGSTVSGPLATHVRTVESERRNPAASTRTESRQLSAHFSSTRPCAC